MEQSVQSLPSSHAVDPHTESTLSSTCWGWLEPSSVLLPFVHLTTTGAAIGRGKEAFEKRVEASQQSPSWTNQLFTARKSSLEELSGLEFVEVADGRVSRMHCVVQRRITKHGTEAILEDCSSNGTFLNSHKLGRGESAVLQDRDRISLVMSVAPMSEQYYVYHKGAPPTHTSEAYRLKRESSSGEGVGTPRRVDLSKWPTCKYTSADRCTLEDFDCQICLNTLVSCVTIEPCGHNFCAVCLSTCPNVERFVRNDMVRDLVDKKKIESRNNTLLASEEDFDQLIDDEMHEMSPVCPLYDDQLPMEVKSLKAYQVEYTLKRLGTEGISTEEMNQCLEVTARLCWSDDAIRKEVSEASGIQIIKKTMEGAMGNEAVQCNGCLALMSLVRGEGSICQWNQWEIARSGAVEVIGRAMRTYASNHMVQLSAMLCFIPLALDNPMMQAHLTQTVQSEILHALDLHVQEADVQCKGLIVLGILAQGEDAVHDAICSRQMEAGMIQRIIKALERYGSSNEEVFWGALFALATLAHEARPRFTTICKSLSQSGVLKLLTSVLRSYEDRMKDSEQSADETIVAAGNYLISAVSEASRRMQYEWRSLLLSRLCLGLLMGSICYFVTMRKRSF